VAKNPPPSPANLVLWASLEADLIAVCSALLFAKRAAGKTDPNHSSLCLLLTETGLEIQTKIMTYVGKNVDFFSELGFLFRLW
jgi:hypothetical protein